MVRIWNYKYAAFASGPFLSSLPSSMLTGYSGCDNDRDPKGSPEIETTLNAHSDWVRDVAWAPNIGLPGEYIATCGQVSKTVFACVVDWMADDYDPRLPLAFASARAQDRTVQIHSRPTTTAAWKSIKLLPHGNDNPDPLFPDAVWRVSWSLAGNVLAVACADGKVTLWKEVVGGKGWECVNEMSG